MFKVPSIPGHSMILWWFYGSRIPRWFYDTTTTIWMQMWDVTNVRDWGRTGAAWVLQVIGIPKISAWKASVMLTWVHLVPTNSLSLSGELQSWMHFKQERGHCLWYSNFFSGYVILQHWSIFKSPLVVTLKMDLSQYSKQMEGIFWNYVYFLAVRGVCPLY